MAFYHRKKGIDLWKEGVFAEYDFCICCKREVSPGAKGFVSIKTNARQPWEPITRSKLCEDCVSEWRELGFYIAICKLPRFKIQ